MELLAFSKAIRLVEKEEKIEIAWNENVPTGQWD